MSKTNPPDSFDLAADPNAGMDSTKGTKLDGGKLRFDLIPVEADVILADILTYGAAKYEDRNWEKGISYMRIYAALRRHLSDWLAGKSADVESGRNPIDQVFWNAMALAVFERRKMTDFDDRPLPRSFLAAGAIIPMQRVQ